MDAEYSALPPLPPPAPPEATPGAAAPHDPVWSGFEVAVVVLFTLLGIVVASLIAGLLWLLWAEAARQAPGQVFALVLVTLVGQTGGMGMGLLLARQWIENVHGARFWAAIHWRRLNANTAMAMVLGGMAAILAVQALAHVLPMPPEVPMDRLFTPRTAWMLLIYGVAVAPFFEEFFFRGLIYPSLRSAFGEGMRGEELQEWRGLVRVVAALGLVGVLWMWARIAVMRLAPGWSGAAELGIAGGLLTAFLVEPGLLLRPAGAAINALAGWRRPELLAIGVTGLLFGLLHAAQLGWSWAAVLIMVLVGMVLTWVRAATGSLMASWLFHCAYNGTLFAAQFVATQGFRHFTPGA